MADPFGNIPLNTNAAQPAPVTPSMPSPTSANTSISAASIPAPAAPVRAPIPAPIPAPIVPDNSHIRVMPRRGGAGPLIGAGIIVVLFIFGGLYFWGAHLNAQEKAPLPLISGDPAQQ